MLAGRGVGNFAGPVRIAIAHVVSPKSAPEKWRARARGVPRGRLLQKVRGVVRLMRYAGGAVMLRRYRERMSGVARRLSKPNHQDHQASSRCLPVTVWYLSPAMERVKTRFPRLLRRV